MSRKDLLADLAASTEITITTSSGRSFTARARVQKVRDLDLYPPIELLDVELGRIEVVAAPGEAAIVNTLTGERSAC